MTRAIALAAGAAAFLIVATANSGGYRYGISDQAFYIPAIAHAVDPSLFARDAAVFAPQTTMWLGDELAAFGLGAPAVDLPVLFAGLYIVGVLLLFGGAAFLARGLGASWWAVAGASALLALRHRIAKTGANSLEGYMHPRMIAFALGLIALGFVLRRRWAASALFVAIAAVVHPTTALWFGGAVVLGATALAGQRTAQPRGRLLIWMAGLAFAGYFTVAFVLQSQRMDSPWLAVIAEKDYLFPHEWPAYAWVINLAYPLVLGLIYRRRKARAVTVPGEWPVVAGLLGLVAGFLLSVPLAAARIAPVVQLQTNRVFWLLDAVTLIYVAWWLIDDAGARRRISSAVAALLIVVACGRGAYILHDTGRPMAEVGLRADAWTDVMQWIRKQPADWQVLADPGHASKYGSSVRVAALHDTVLEQSKDSAMAMYDRRVAARVGERAAALSGFADFPAETYRDLGRRFDVRVLVLERGRGLALPRLYENARFVVYDLR